MAKRFLTDIDGRSITISEVPLLPAHVVNRLYVDPRLMPPGGATNEVLTKTAGTDYAVAWLPGGAVPVGGHITIDMGTFLNTNGYVDCGSFI